MGFPLSFIRSGRSQWLELYVFELLNKYLLYLVLLAAIWPSRSSLGHSAYESSTISWWHTTSRLLHVDSNGEKTTILSTLSFESLRMSIIVYCTTYKKSEGLGIFLQPLSPVLTNRLSSKSTWARVLSVFTFPTLETTSFALRSQAPISIRFWVLLQSRRSIWTSVKLTTSRWPKAGLWRTPSTSNSKTIPMGISNRTWFNSYTPSSDAATLEVSRHFIWVNPKSQSSLKVIGWAEIFSIRLMT